MFEVSKNTKDQSKEKFGKQIFYKKNVLGIRKGMAHSKRVNEVNVIKLLKRGRSG